MASSLRVMTASQSIFESVGYNAERLAALKYSDLRRCISAEKMDLGSPESSEEEEESDEEEIEEDCPVFVLQSVLETLSMILKLWLRRIHLTEQDQRKNLQNVEHKIYKVQEEVIIPFKAFLESKKREDLEDLPMLDFHIQRLEEACQILWEEKNKVNFQIPEEDSSKVNEYTRCCSLLGLKLDFLDRLEEMPSRIRDHRTLCSWIVIFLRNNYNTLSLTEKNSSNKEQLYTIGFDHFSSAVETILERAGSMQQHIDACEWAEIFIKDQFKYNVLLSHQSSTFPFQSDKTNEWFQWHNDDDDCHVNVANLVTTTESESSTVSRSMLRNFQLEDQQHTVLFHGTDHESANDILNGRGIHLGAGRTKRDFSSGAGFYLTKSMDDALSWASSTTVKPAILVFRVELALLNNKARKLNLNQDDAYGQWREIVTSFRLDKPTAKLRNSLSEYDVIEGPLAARSGGPSNGGELVFEPIPYSYQMCLISEDFADKFHQTLHSVLFYDIC